MIELLLFALVYLWMSAKAWNRTPTGNSPVPEDKPVDNPPSIEETAGFGVVLVGLGAGMTSPVIMAIPFTISLLTHTRWKHAWGPVHTGIVTAVTLAAPVLILQTMQGGWSFSMLGIATYTGNLALLGLGMFVGARRGYYRYQKAVLDPITHLPDSDISQYLSAGISNRNQDMPDWFYEDSQQATVQSAGETGSVQRSKNVDLDIDPEDLTPDPEDHPLLNSNNNRGDGNSEEQESSVDKEITDSKSVEDPDVVNQSREQPDEPDSEKMEAEENHIEGGTGQPEPEFDELQHSWNDPPDVDFQDIGGYSELKEEIIGEIIEPLTSDNPGFTRFDVEPDRGLLLYGPPGTGKTLFARALANALDRPFVELSQADLTHQHINKSPRIIKRAFEEAQALGGVLFIDEAENLVRDRTVGGSSHAEDDKVVSTFKTYLTKEDKSFILVLTTNDRDMIDEAILRPGRLDNKMEVGLPNREARLKILSIKTGDVPCNVSRETLKSISAQTEGWSGADLELLVERAKRRAAEQNAESLTHEHLQEALKELQESGDLSG